MTKTLREKAINIKGKDYVLVSDRVIYFNEEYKEGAIITKLLSAPDSQMVVIQAKVTPDVSKPERFFTGLSQAKWGEGMVNKTAALENAETSAVGRALGMMGIGVLDSIASADEMNKATAAPRPQAQRSQTYTAHAQPVQNTANFNLGNCPKCGSPMKMSKQGRPYCSAKCWLNQQPVTGEEFERSI